MAKKAAEKEKKRRALMRELLSELKITNARGLFITLWDLCMDVRQEMISAELDELLDDAEQEMGYTWQERPVKLFSKRSASRK